MVDPTVNLNAGMDLWHFIKKNIYWIITCLILIPIIIGTLIEAFKTANWFLPVFRLITYIFGADNIIGVTITQLKTDPVKLIGMAYPNLGIFQHFKYYRLYFVNVIWTIFTAFWMIFFPWYLIYLCFKSDDNGKTNRNITWSIICFIGIMIFFNMLFLIISLMTKQTVVDISSLKQTDQVLQVIYSITPFHGIINFVTYIISLLR